MDVKDYQDEFTELLGAYALDAVDPDEAERIELHLVDCPRCRAEVGEHREVAAFLSQSGAPAPEGVWDRIASELSPPAPPLRLTFEPTSDRVEGASSAVVTPLGEAPSRRRQAQTRTLMAIIGVAACIVAVLGIVTVRQSQRVDNLASALNDTSIDRAANAAVANSKVDVSLKGDAGTARAVVGSTGHGYLITEGIPAPETGNVYQLWGKVDGTVLSLGTFGDGTSVVPFSVDPGRLDDIELFAVTQEKAPGVLASKNQPVMAGEV